MNKRNYFLFITLCCFIICLSHSAIADDDFLSSTFNNNPIFIPKIYNQGSVLKPDINVELVQVGVMYPGFSPSDKPRKEIISEKEIKNYIHLSISPIKKKEFTFSELVEKQFKYSELTFTEKKYGLEKISEPYKDFQQQKDVWFVRVDRRPVSYISCTTAVFDAKGTTELQVEPKDYRCSHYFFSNDTLYIVKFHNSLLPYWKEIQAKSIAFFDSFKSKESALNYLRSAIE